MDDYFSDNDTYNSDSSSADSDQDIHPVDDYVDEEDVADKPAEQDLAMYDLVEAVLDLVDKSRSSIGAVLEALLWGEEKCKASLRMRTVRQQFTRSKELATILNRLWKPPGHDPVKNGNSGRQVTVDFVSKTMKKVHKHQIEDLSSLFVSPPSDDTTIDELTSLDFLSLAETCAIRAPDLWGLLLTLTQTPRQARDNTHKSPTKVPYNLIRSPPRYLTNNQVILMVVAILLYTRTHHCNKIQKAFAIYVKFRGLSAKAFDTMHALGVTMSHKWTSQAVVKISERATKAMRIAILLFAMWMSYDNMQMPFKVYSQRIENPGEFGNGTAATAFINRNKRPLTAKNNAELRKTRISPGQANPLKANNILKLATDGYARLRPYMVHRILRFLLDAPDFELKTYKGNKSTLFAPPVDSRDLVYGPENCTEQFMLGSMNIPEASYEDNLKVIQDILRQLGFDTADKEQKLAIERLLTFCGDQLTIERLRGLLRA